MRGWVTPQRRSAACSGVSATVPDAGEGFHLLHRLLARSVLCGLHLTLLGQREPSRSGQFNIPWTRRLGLLLERVQDSHKVLQACGVDHTVRPRLVPDSKLLHALADGWHGLEVGRLLAPLDLLQLVAGVLPHVFRELPKTLERVAQEPYWLHTFTISD